MKKLLLIICILASFFGSNVFAQSWVEDVYLYDDFGTTGGTSTGNWVNGTAVFGNATGYTTGSGNTFSSAVNTTNKNVQLGAKVFNYTFIKNTKTLPYVYNPTTGSSGNPSTGSGKLTVQYICKIGSAQTYSGGYYYFRDASNRPIFGLGFARITANGSTQWYPVRLPSYVEWADAAASYPNIADRILLYGTAVIGSPAIKVTAVLDFTNHTYNLTTITGTYTPNGSPEWVDGSTTSSNLGLPFLDSNASDISNILFEMNGKDNGSATTVNPYFTFDNFKIAGEKQSTTYGDVTVKYVNTDDASSLSAVKADIPHTGLLSGSTYTATGGEMANFTDGTFNYVYDASSTNSTTVVENTNTDITLKFKKYPILSGETLTWGGYINGTLNDFYANFSSDGTNRLGYQPSNELLFPSSASNKTVTINSALDLGANNLSITGTGYNIATGVLGSIAGTGALNIGLNTGDVLTLNATNNMTGITQISGGTITLSKVGTLGVTPNITGSTTLNYGATGISIPATTFGASSSLAAGNYASSSISGMSAASGIKISVSAGTNHANNDNTRAFDFAASGTLASGSELELNGTGTDNRIGMTSASTSYLANTKVSLK